MLFVKGKVKGPYIEYCTQSRVEFAAKMVYSVKHVLFSLCCFITLSAIISVCRLVFKDHVLPTYILVTFCFYSSQIPKLCMSKIGPGIILFFGFSVFVYVNVSKRSGFDVSVDTFSDPFKNCTTNLKVLFMGSADVCVQSKGPVGAARIRFLDQIFSSVQLLNCTSCHQRLGLFLTNVLK